MTKSKEGKTENSSVLRTFMVNNNIKKESEILIDKKKSKINEGRGIKNIPKIMIIIPTAINSPLPPILDRYDLRLIFCAMFSPIPTTDL